ncbi:hypothetical protein DQ04_06661030 [Trypanosoma grayi]|uniref:hypothetical protein n=1 Tax=Trypanosoma grayi TaxID=71804 RepID=UPI0004F41CA1|nr:hypothetical protein DQ04_06661030 [Trypanosoma grayi]KEG08678.1 hypothetical protein DQ04_06661030 [Trypanosoma grayi]
MVQSRPAVEGTAGSASAYAAPTAVAVRYVPRSWTYAQTMIQHRRERLANGDLDRRPQQQQQQNTNGERSSIEQHPSASARLVPPPTCKEFIGTIVRDVVDSVMQAPCLERLTSLQAADGSFPLNAILGVSVGVPLEQLERGVPLTGFGVSEDLTAARVYLSNHERVWATAVAAAAMERCPHAITALAYKKALVYTAGHDAEGELLQRARDLFVRLPSLSH